MPDKASVSAALARLAQLHPKLIDLSLDRMHAVLAALGHPERRLPPIIHVAGTNGKGSTVAFLRAIVEAAGLTAHVYTSPHLVRPNERVRLAGTLIDDATFVGVLEEVEAASRETGITQFEAWTAAALLAFSRVEADYLLLEVGLGGRFDATNVIANPAVTVITPVDYDHQDFLGNTLTLIAGEKAAILKRGAPAVLARQQDEAADRIASEAEGHNVALQRFGIEWDAFGQHGRMTLQYEKGLLDLPLPSLLGAHQIENAGTAAMAAMALNDARITPEAIAKGIATAQWPARMQPITSGPLASLVQARGAELWLDGGHNPHGGAAVAAAFAKRNNAAPMPLVLIVGMLNTKDRLGFLRCYRALSEKLIAVPVTSSAAGVAPEMLAIDAVSLGFEAEIASDVTAAVERALAESKTTPRILITGSLYIAGEVLALGPPLL